MEGNGELSAGASAEVIVGDEGGNVFWRFQQPTLWFRMEPANALLIAEATARAAHNAATGAHIDLVRPGVSQLSAQLRNRAVSRVQVMLHSMRQANHSNEYLASAIVDAVATLLR